MSMQPPLKAMIWRILREEKVPGLYAVEEDGPDAVVYYRDDPRPTRRPDANGVYRLIPEARLEACREALAQVQYLTFDEITWQGKTALRVKELA